MQDSHAVHGLEISSDISNRKVCSGCALGKAHLTAVSKKYHSRSTKLLQLIHSHVSEPIEVPSLGGSRYFVTFIDDFSRWATMYTMKAKSETFKCFRTYHAHAKKHTGSKTKILNVV